MVFVKKFRRPWPCLYTIFSFSLTCPKMWDPSSLSWHLGQLNLGTSHMLWVPWKLGFSSWALLTLWPDNSWLWSCPTKCRMVSNISGFYPPDANSILFTPNCDTSRSPGMAKCLLRGDSPLGENHWYKGKQLCRMVLSGCVVFASPNSRVFLQSHWEINVRQCVVYGSTP